MDRRKRKSRQAILAACLQLVETKDFEAITIQEIAEQADLNRGTFYLHYADKYDMLNQYEDALVEKIEQVILKNLHPDMSPELFFTTRYTTFIELLYCFKAEQQMIQFIMKTKGSTSFQLKLNKLFQKLNMGQVIQQLVPNSVVMPVPMDIFMSIFVAVVTSIAQDVEKWEQSVQLEGLATFIIDAIINGPAKVLGVIDGERIDVTPLIHAGQLAVQK